MTAGPPRCEPLGPRLGWMVFLVALALRLTALAELSGSVWNEVPLGDARFFDEWGQRIAAGDWLGTQVFFQAPLYPYLLGALFALFGHHLLVVRVLQCLAGAGMAFLSASTGARLFGRRAGAAAGFLAALYVPAVAYDLRIEKASLATFLTALLSWWVLRRPPTPLRSLVSGAVLAALVLLRENAAILLVPLAAVAFGERARRIPRLAALLGGMAAVLTPVIARNAFLGGGFVPTATNIGVNFFLGSGPGADGMYRPLVEGRGHPDHEREDAQALAEELSGRLLSPGEVSDFWLGLTLREIARDPLAFVRLEARKLRLLTSRVEIMDGLALESQVDESWLMRLLWPSAGFGLLLPLFAVGVLRTRGRAPIAWPLASAGVLALGILAFFVNARFRLGLVPFLLPFAGVGLVEIGSVRRAPRELALLLAAGTLAWAPLDLPGNPRSTSASNLASELMRRGRLGEAETWARRSVELDPTSAEAAYNLGLALRRLGRDAEAAQPFQDAARLEPAYRADVLAELGAIRAVLGDRDGARSLIEQALALDPEHAAANRYLRTLRLEESDRSE